MISFLLVLVVLLGILVALLGCKPCDNPELVNKAFESYIFCTIDEYLLKDSVAFKEDKKLFNDYYKQLTPKDRNYLHKKLVEYESVTGKDIKTYLKYYK